MEERPAKWNVVDALAEELNMRKDVAENLIHMLEKEECTVPFIARYRKEKTRGLDADALRKAVSLLEELRNVQKKCESYIKAIRKQGKLTNHITESLCSAQSLEELEHVYAPYKGEKKGTLANKARQLGLQSAADELLRIPNQCNLRNWVKKGTEGLSTLSEVESGVEYIIADIVSKDGATLEKLRLLFTPNEMQLQSKLSKSAKKILDKEQASTDINHNKSKQQFGSSNSKNDLIKYKNYFDFNVPVKYLKSYQVLAINRGEAQKYLTVNIQINERTEKQFICWCMDYWSPNLKQTPEKDGKNISTIRFAIQDSWKRLIRPFVVRKIRNQLLKQAQGDATEVFSHNVKKLLLTAPLRGKIVLGIDPGFKNGCKCAVVSSNGTKVLGTDVFNLRDKKRSIGQIKKLYNNFKFDYIAIGNGTACRETEKLVSDFIRSQRGLNLHYCIINENGASIYSVTEEAKFELPNLDPNLRSAVSIARRLQDPLVELVKVDPKNLGVGMYQHDIPPKLLTKALDDVVEECVTFVGVDLNVGNITMLTRVAGIKPAQAKKIIEWRDKNGNFINREQLRSIKGIGDKTYQQCVGFLRIHASQFDTTTQNHTAVSNSRKRKIKETGKSLAKKAKMDIECNPLDQTWIHPESYNLATKVVKEINLSIENLGQESFTKSVQNFLKSANLEKMSEKLNIGCPTLKLILDGLGQAGGNKDIRDNFTQPIYRKGITNICDLKRGSVLTGRVGNVTDFGVFIDIGVGKDGLSPVSKVQNWDKVRLEIGPNDAVTVRVDNLDLKTERITLQLLNTESNNISLC